VVLNTTSNTTLLAWVVLNTTSNTTLLAWVVINTTSNTTLLAWVVINTMQGHAALFSNNVSTGAVICAADKPEVGFYTVWFNWVPRRCCWTIDPPICRNFDRFLETLCHCVAPETEVVRKSKWYKRVWVNRPDTGASRDARLACALFSRQHGLTTCRR
jgi:hypothetical protein